MRTSTRVWDALCEEFGGRTFLLLSIETVELFVVFYEQARGPRGLNLEVAQTLKAWTTVELHVKLPAGEDPITIPASITFAAPSGVVVAPDLDSVAERWQELGEDFGILDGGLCGEPELASDPFRPAPPSTREPRLDSGVHERPTIAVPESSDSLSAMRPIDASRESRDLPQLHKADQTETPLARVARPQSKADAELQSRSKAQNKTMGPAAPEATPPETHTALPHDALRGDLLARTAPLATLYEGSLTDCGIREWLTDSLGRKEDGLCTVRAPTTTYYVLVAKGEVVDVQAAPEAETSMAGMLAQTDFVDDRALEVADKKAIKEGRDLGDVLIELGTLDHKTVVCVRHARVAYLMRNVVKATEGTFAYTPLNAMPYPARIPPVKF
jgi:hypothetical protein